jgi:hypothetical protein
LREGLGMMYFHLKGLPHLLTYNQKAMRIEVAKVTAQQLAVHPNAGFQNPLTGDET